MSVPVSTGICDDPTPNTPGSPARRCLNWSTKAMVFSPSYPLNCGEIEKVIRFSVLNPRFCLRRFHRVCANSVAPASSSTVNATCPATSTLRKRTWPGPADPVEPWSFRICDTPPRATRHAGIQPNTKAEAAVAAAANPRTVASTCEVIPCTPPSETTAWVKMFINQAPRRMPNPPPATAQRKLSTIN